AESIEEAAIHAAVVDDSHRAAVAIGQNRLGAVGGFGDLAKTPSDGVERLVPAYSLESSFAFGADSSHRIEHALRVVDAFEVSSDFSAEKALGSRMIGIAADFRSSAVLDFDEHSASVGAIVRTGGVNCSCFAHRVFNL